MEMFCTVYIVFISDSSPAIKLKTLEHEKVIELHILLPRAHKWNVTLGVTSARDYNSSSFPLW